MSRLVIMHTGSYAGFWLEVVYAIICIFFFYVGRL